LALEEEETMPRLLHSLQISYSEATGMASRSGLPGREARGGTGGSMEKIIGVEAR